MYFDESDARRQAIQHGRRWQHNRRQHAISGYSETYSLKINKLIFKRLSDDVVYTENDKQTYKNILLITNAHRCDHNAFMPILRNESFNYKHIIAPLLLDKDKMGAGTGLGAGKATRRRINAISRATTESNTFTGTIPMS
ncbi:hypothetical protein P5V15_001035 [Pogonomyrmex californicus]